MKQSPMRFTIRSLQIAVLGAAHFLHTLSVRRPTCLLARARRISVLPPDVFAGAPYRVRYGQRATIRDRFSARFRAGTRSNGVLRGSQSRAVFCDDTGAAGLVPAANSTRTDDVAEGLGRPEYRVGAGDLCGIDGLWHDLRWNRVCNRRKFDGRNYGATRRTRRRASGDQTHGSRISESTNWPTNRITIITIAGQP